MDPSAALPAPPTMLVDVPGGRQQPRGGTRGLLVVLGALALAGASFAAVWYARQRAAKHDEPIAAATLDAAGPRGDGALAGSAVAMIDAAPMAAVTLDAAPALDAAEAIAAAGAIEAIDAAEASDVELDAALALDALALDARTVDAASAVPLDAAARPPVDAAPPRPPIDAASATPIIDEPATGDKLVIDLQPHGARVFVDGKEVGKSPVSLAAGGGRREVAAFAPGRRLYTATIDGSGRHQATLAAAPSWGGAGGIKVRCKTARRYYVFVDGKDTGQLCPTERIGLKMGKHTVEIYDPITRSRRSFPADVVDTGHSLKVDVD
jgi:hypothetical protein